MIASERYFNRELSWLSFNYRVLMEAMDETLPLYERIKFLAIYSSNLNEYFRVRVAAIQTLLEVEPSARKISFDPETLLKAIYAEVARQQDAFGITFRERILPELQDNGIHLVRGTPSDPAHKEFVTEFFMEELRPFLHAELLRKEKIVHFLRDGALYLCARLWSKTREERHMKVKTSLLDSKRRIRYALIQVPTHYFDRFVTLPQLKGEHYYMFLEDVIRNNLDRIFPGYHVVCAHAIKINRNADLQLEDEVTDDIAERVRESLKRRRIGSPARFLYDMNMPEPMLKYLMETFDIGKREIMKGGAYHNFMDFFQFPNPKAPELERPSISPLPDKELDAFPTIVAAMKERNRILHFPYQTYDYVIRFLNQAAIDPSVKHIYATQYRVASNSAIVNALIRAAQQGRKVTVFVEITARFDEALNLHMAQEMEKAGINIIYTVPKLKVHAKVALVIREQDGEEKGYAFLSTGNFNEKTARIYSDFGYFTTDEDLIAELREVFAFLLEPKHKPRPFEKLLVAPFNIRQQFCALIDREIAHARAGRPAEILMKLNNIDDTQMIDKLYEASQAGVRIRMIVRGMCSLLPEVPGLSDNISVVRIVDQFLEHARAWWFRNDGQDELYLGSSDWMQRNLSRRVEVVFPLRNPALKAEVMQILHIQLADNVKAVRLNAKMENRRIESGAGPAVRAQIEIYERIRDGRLMDPLPEAPEASPASA